jgi:hypothetical protein
VPLLLEPIGHRLSVSMVFRTVADEDGGHGLWRYCPGTHFTRAAHFLGQ